MPFGDRTGPWGLGPRSGRGMGFCSGFPTPGFMNWGFGFGRGRGRGLGRWLGFGGYAPGWWGMPFQGYTPTPGTMAPSLEALKQQAAMLEQQLEAVREQINKLQEPDKE